MAMRGIRKPRRRRRQIEVVSSSLAASGQTQREMEREVVVVCPVLSYPYRISRYLDSDSVASHSVVEREQPMRHVLR